MPSPRAVLVMVPPLLADMIQAVLSSRTDIEIAAVFDGVGDLASCMREIAPEIVIVGAAPAAPSREQVRSWLPDARVFTLSADLRSLEGPDAGQDTELAPDAIAARLSA